MHKLIIVFLVATIVDLNAQKPFLPGLDSWRPTPSGGLLLTDYGAKCDGLTDDTVAIQAAINDADIIPYSSVVIPAGVCLFSSTLIFGNHTDRYSTISVIGNSEYVSELHYTGSKDSPAILISHMAAFTWQSFAVVAQDYASSNKGTSSGILFDAPEGNNGTQNTTITLSHIAVAGFHFGIVAGGISEASEIDCHQCSLTYNDIGFTSAGFNSLNFWFFASHTGFNQIGYELGGPTWVGVGVHIIGGTSTHNSQADFWCTNEFDILGIQDYRAEIPTNSLLLGGTYCNVVSISKTVAITDAANNIIDLNGFSSLSIDDSKLQGIVNVTNVDLQFGQRLRMNNNFVTEGTSGWPLRLPAESHNRLFMNLNLNTKSDSLPFTDFNGSY